jgi:hypothetical protein
MRQCICSWAAYFALNHPIARNFRESARPIGDHGWIPVFAVGSQLLDKHHAMRFSRFMGYCFGSRNGISEGSCNKSFSALRDREPGQNQIQIQHQGSQFRSELIKANVYCRNRMDRRRIIDTVLIYINMTPSFEIVWRRLIRIAGLPVAAWLNFVFITRLDCLKIANLEILFVCPSIGDFNFSPKKISPLAAVLKAWRDLSGALLSLIDQMFCKLSKSSRD